MATPPPRPLVLDLLRQARLDQIELQRTARQRIWDQYNREVLDAKHRVSRLMNQAVGEGISLAAVSRELGTRNWDQLKKLMALAATEAQSEAAVVQSVEQTEADARAYADAHPWEYDAETSMVTFNRWVGEDREFHYETRVLGWDPEAERGSGGVTGDTSGMQSYNLHGDEFAIRKSIREGPSRPAPEPAPTPTIDWTMFGMPDDEDEDE